MWLKNNFLNKKQNKKEKKVLPLRFKNEVIMSDYSNAGYKEGFVSVIVNILLFGLKIWAGIVSGSIALIADAWHTLSDSLTSIIVIVTTKLSSRKPDKKHPFGHGRWEQIAAIFMAFLLALIGYEFIKDAIECVENQTVVEFGTLAVVVTVLSIVTKFCLTYYAFYLGNKTKNTSIKADAWHHGSDALSSVVVLIGIFIAKYFWWIDSALGIIISLFLFYGAAMIIKEAITKLLGEEPSDDLIKEINNIINKIYGNDLKLHHFHIHNYIQHQELTFHIRLDKNMTIESGHKIASKIEDEIIKQTGIVTTIHVEPLFYE
jgi:cation diffusion facilitator family transporter